MFEELSDACLIEVMGEATRDESTAIAQRLAAVAELYERRVGSLAECEWWCTDYCDAVAAEISAVQNISHARAVSQVQFACALAHRLPRLAKLFGRGVIDFRVVRAIVSRTENVEAEVMPALDEAIARHAEKWMKLSEHKLRDRVDQWVAKFDPAGVRVPAAVEDKRYVEVQPSTTAGMAFFHGHIRAEDGAALDARLEALAATVCENDPRTKAQRRSDACGPLGRGEAMLACQCGSADCPAAAVRASAASAVIHLLAEQSTVEGTGDTPGYLRGFGVMPAESVRRIAATARLKPLTVPADTVTADPRYRPSAKTAEFVRWRDLTCRWPGCDKPVEKSDIDHTVPYPLGPTHPSNTKHYCRVHHLIKTFMPGWSDQQMPDGTIILKAPTGHVYSTEPHGAAMFPDLGRWSAELNLPAHFTDTGADRSVMMPRRKKTREQARRERIDAERRHRIDLNAELAAEQQRQQHARLAENDIPPPF